MLNIILNISVLFIFILLYYYQLFIDNTNKFYFCCFFRATLIVKVSLHNLYTILTIFADSSSFFFSSAFSSLSFSSLLYSFFFTFFNFLIQASWSPKTELVSLIETADADQPASYALLHVMLSSLLTVTMTMIIVCFNT